MKTQEYQAFTNALRTSLENDSRVTGLIAAGSMAAMSHQPDQWSDHDFWVIVESGTEGWFHSHTDWLPYREQIVLHFREPHGGFKTIYRNGHLIEFAVSDHQGLLHARVNDYRLLIDRVGLESDLVQMQQTTTREFETAIQDDFCLLGQCFTLLLVGVGRYRQGELLSARQSITVSAPSSLLRLIAKHRPCTGSQILDNLDPLRRFEFAYPDYAAEIDNLLRLDLDKAAIGLLDFADCCLRDNISDYPVEAFEAIRKQLLA